MSSTLVDAGPCAHVSVRSDQSGGRGVQLDAGAVQGYGLAHPQVNDAPLPPTPQIGQSTGLLQHTSGVIGVILVVVVQAAASKMWLAGKAGSWW